MPLAPMTVSMPEMLSAALVASRVTLALPSPEPSTVAMPCTERLPSVSRVTVSLPALPMTTETADTLTALLVASSVTVLGGARCGQNAGDIRHADGAAGQQCDGIRDAAGADHRGDVAGVTGG